MPDYIIRRIESNELNVCVEVIRESFFTVAKAFNLTKENCPSNGAFMKTDRLLIAGILFFCYTGTASAECFLQFGMRM